MLRDVNFQKVVQHTKIQHATCNLLQASYIKGSLFLTILTLSGPIIHFNETIPFICIIGTSKSNECHDTRGKNTHVEYWPSILDVQVKDLSYENWGKKAESSHLFPGGKINSPLLKYIKFTVCMIWSTDYDLFKEHLLAYQTNKFITTFLNILLHLENGDESPHETPQRINSGLIISSWDSRMLLATTQNGITPTSWKWPAMCTFSF